MDMICDNNFTRLCGSMGGKPVYSHSSRAQQFYIFPLEVERLSGTLCKAPNLRTTPMGRDICDLMLAVNRHYGRSDYLPCICWGLKAREAAGWTVGTHLRLQGRIQSRRYIKLTEEGPVEKTAFEVSVTDAAPDTGDEGKEFS